MARITEKLYEKQIGGGKLNGQVTDDVT